MNEKWAGFGIGRRAQERIAQAERSMKPSDLSQRIADRWATVLADAQRVNQRIIDAILSGTTSEKNEIFRRAPERSSSSVTGFSASLAAPLERTDSNSTTSNTDPKAADTTSSTSSPSASSATTSSTPDSSTLSLSSGAEVSGPCSVVECGVPERPDRSKVHIGDALARLKELPDESVHSIITSPPYYKLRDYKVDGQIGRESTLQEYVANVVAIMREARRVLRDDGTCALVLGDTYATTGNSGKRGATSARAGRSHTATGMGATAKQGGVKPKDLLGVPWRIAFAMQDDGWYLRSEIVWEKSNPMPESVTDRVTRAHETVFVFAKSQRYYWDRYAILEPSVSGPSDRKKMLEAQGRITAKHLAGEADARNAASDESNIGRKRAVGTPGVRNARSVWTIATEPYRGKHFATFPKKLVERLLGATTSQWVCKACGVPWTRVVEKHAAEGRGSGQVERKFRADHGGDLTLANAHIGTGVPWSPSTVETLGWELRCGHFDAGARSATVLDPFAGAMTTAIVAERMMRKFIGIELNAEYVTMGIERIVAERAKWERQQQKRSKAA